PLMPPTHLEFPPRCMRHEPCWPTVLSPGLPLVTPSSTTTRTPRGLSRRRSMRQLPTGNASAASSACRGDPMTATYDVINPATEQRVTTVELYDAAATDDAIARPRRAFESWRVVAP